MGKSNATSRTAVNSRLGGPRVSPVCIRGTGELIVVVVVAIIDYQKYELTASRIVFIMRRWLILGGGDKLNDSREGWVAADADADAEQLAGCNLIGALVSLAGGRRLQLIVLAHFSILSPSFLYP